MVVLWAVRIMGGVLLGMLVVSVVLLVAVPTSEGQQPPPAEPLAQCQSTLRVTTELRTQAETIAASLLTRAEKAETSLRAAQTQVEDLKKELAASQREKP